MLKFSLYVLYTCISKWSLLIYVLKISYVLFEYIMTSGTFYTHKNFSQG